ncbi:ATP dependent helicase, Lhr family [Desulfotomaculum arcticum]|uniref:ATP dependent helicase, Lhr family n=1 Tax=Desulfotruncus arcticus DSM 17038 TaxID=1121424 RepID=A0A1I2VWC2_9FIRM|nr:DEAD/DEAH box helicase [Desulfotruncus arcticus]SFG93538.1 ATP dependent helicase, Lhr family [Desulfotomaculum arcticum] [Desulfotruncus arcticus DSM 17038]
MNHPVLDLFHPLIRQWFAEKVGLPTDIQVQAWPRVAQGEHVLITAPTGSGKTLTAFLWALQKLITGDWPGGRVRVLYVSPLKALNNDVQRNLLKPLHELRAYFAEAGALFPSIRVLTRSGDTPANERRQMLRRPPEILITTPESLNLLLSSKNNRLILSGVETVILDEIHAVLDSKRGTHLITAVDRLVPMAGEFQRIALSATVRPLEPVAAFVGGLKACRSGEDYRYQKRPVVILRSTVKKQYHLTVEAIEQNNDGLEGAEQDALWQTLAAALTKVIRANTATLVFCNSRRTVEKLTRYINDAAGEPLVYSHHGSLARELRLAVEHKLKYGELKGIVATNSLELGIDIGELDAVLLVQTPSSLTAAIQRIGRAGHGVGQVSRGILFPLYGRDLVEAAVASLSLPVAEIEPIAPVEAPLDVLAQVLLSMTAVETWDVDDLYAFLKTSYPYRNLSRKSYDLLLEMLAGRYADTRLRELKPRVILDKLDHTVKARDGAARLVYLGGGTIPDRGCYDLRLMDTKAKIGELDEEFVWERNVGETFMLGTRVWRIMRVTHNDVEVIPGDRTINIIPFWRAEEQNQDFYYAEKIGLFLEEADQNLETESFAHQPVFKNNWSAYAVERLIAYLKRQKEVTGQPLPHRHHILIEHFADPLNTADSKQVIVHTLWGGKVNRPLAMALAAAWERKFGYPLEIYVGNNSIMLILPHSFAPQDLFSLVSPQNLEHLLRSKLASSGFFGAKFRENAGRALLLPKANFKKRMPLWLNRLRAKKLMAAVTPYADFPIMLETWRTCLKDEFDLETVKQLLEEINDDRIRISETVTHQPSPFASDVIWRQTNKYMYEDDTPFSDQQSGLSRELLQELVYAPHLRLAIPAALVRELDGKLKRTAPGYAPTDGEELLLWIKERLFIPADEAAVLFAAMERDNQSTGHGLSLEKIKLTLSGKVAWLHLPGAEQPGLCALEILPRIVTARGVGFSDLDLRPLTPQAAGQLSAGINKAAALLEQETSTEPGEFGSDTALLVSQWLSYYGPVPRDFVGQRLGLPAKDCAAVLATLLEEECIVADVLTQGAGEAEVCDRENLERLFAMARRARQPEFEPLPVTVLPLFLATYQGVVEKGTTMEDLQARLEQLFGYLSQARLWEEAILPARLEPYYPTWMDSLMQTSDLIWFGCGNKRVCFCLREDLELFPPGKERRGAEDEAQARALFPDPWGKYDFFILSRHTGLSSDDLTCRLWEHVWRGSVSNDSFAVLRRGILTNFTPLQAEGKRGFSRRAGYSRWSVSRPLQGSWYALPESEERDLIEQEELVKDRIRQLFSRYGVLFRELLQQEIPELQWRRIFRTLRLMEFSGEIYAGHFFAQITGLQFVSREANRFLRRGGLNEESIYWLNAADPASPCGLKLPGMDEDLPARLPTNYIVFHGARLKVVAKRNGKELLIKAEPGDPAVPAYFAFCKTFLTREFNPLKSVVVETVNGRPVTESPYKKALQSIGFTGEYKSLVLRRQY